MVRSHKPPSPAWRAFLKNHIKDIAAIDSSVVPTLRSQILFVFLVLAHDRRRVLHFNVTSNPTAESTVQPLVEAFPWELQAEYLLRDRDKTYGDAFKKQVRDMGFEGVLIAPRSPGQDPFACVVPFELKMPCRTTIYSAEGIGFEFSGGTGGVDRGGGTGDLER